MLFRSDITPLAVATALFSTVFYFKFITLITRGDTTFSKWHYLIPVMLFVTDLMLRFFGLNNHLPERFIEVLYAIFYLLLSLRLLVRYSDIKKAGNEVSKKVRRWIVLLGASPSLIATMYLLSFTITAENGFISGVLITLIILLVLINSLIAYSVLSRRFLFYVQFPKSEKIKKPEMAETADPATPIRTHKRRISETVTDENGKHIVVKLTKERFEAYMQKEKPYLNPHLKITDLIEPLKANRTFISNFVNQTYGLNFNQYINSLRIKELEHLSAMASNSSKKTADLVEKAGFATLRNYTRALSARQNDNEN